VLLEESKYVSEIGRLKVVFSMFEVEIPYYSSFINCIARKVSSSLKCTIFPK